MARPTKFTPDTIKRLTDAIRIGSSIESACRYAGIGESTYYEWARGEFPRGVSAALKTQFSEELTRAMGEADMNDLITIRQAAKAGDWRAAAWGLERRHPSEYGKRDSVNITIELRHKAEQIAERLGVSVDDVLNTAQAVAAGAWDTWEP